MQVGSVGMPAHQFEDVEFIDADSSTLIKPGNSETVNVRASAGYIYELVGVDIEVPLMAASAGTHTITIQSETADIRVVSGTSQTANLIRYAFGVLATGGAGAAEMPANDSEQQKQIDGKRFSATDGLDIVYDNNTNSNQAGTRQIRLWVKKLKVG